MQSHSINGNGFGNDWSLGTSGTIKDGFCASKVMFPVIFRLGHVESFLCV